MPQSPPPDVIIVGASTRAAAESAIRAGLRPWCVDLFADRDLTAIAPAAACEHGSYPIGLVKLVQQANLNPATSVLFTGAMENHAQATTALQALHPIRGLNTQGMAAMRKLGRQPEKWTAIHGIKWPRTLDLSDDKLAVDAITQLVNSHGHTWLIKPIHSAGGTGIKRIDSSTPLSPDGPTCGQGELLQQYIQGRPVGAVFRSKLKPAQDRQRAKQPVVCELLGVSEQIIGDAHFGAKGFGYVGSIGPVQMTAKQTAALCELGKQLVNKQPTADLFGVDLILDEQGELWPIEINPRYTASVEVLEKACRFAALDHHSKPQPGNIAGKAYVFAKADSKAPDLYAHFNHDQIADVPHVGSDLMTGHPICTLLATAASLDECRMKLREMATSLYSRLQ